jgi:hypothetical protein
MEFFFSSVNVHYTRTKNMQVDSLVKAASTFAPPTTLKLKYHIKMRDRPSIVNNIKHWKVFEYDEHIRKLL